ncbi:glucose 1-dehydrogenase [Geodermatophilus sp. TF02-6]|uniref:glucose 1-dehydrogenase n=1 Tax=Geodermatophilus sp. TF02-6 TaxID=2250575 RepID=UPI0018F2E37B|nr:glucose 1-dehydrogenase [Geodermatophilus sp. TF02-6]
MPEPPVADGPLLVETLAIGICGTDLEIAAGDYGEAPPGEDHLVIGHESLGRVAEAPADSGFAAGDLVVGIVRRPDPVPCANCAVGEWDMCRNGRYTERGIKGLHGYASERYRISPDFAVALDPALSQVGVLLEPTTVVAKAWDHIERIGHRVHWEPRTVAVTGAGPIGLLAALLGVQRGLEVHVLDVVEHGVKPELTRALGAEYHTQPIGEIGLAPDVIVECSGVPSVVMDVLYQSGHDGVVCLTGVSPRGRNVTVDAGALGREIVLENDAIFGSVNANRAHYEQAAQALADADTGWLERLITRRVPLDGYADALQRHAEDVKVVLEMQA